MVIGRPFVGRGSFRVDLNWAAILAEGYEFGGHFCTVESLSCECELGGHFCDL